MDPDAAEAPTTTTADTAAVKVVLCDIEGTTTPIAFVKDILFPYALDNVRGHLERTWTLPETRNVVEMFRAEAQADDNGASFQLAAADASTAEQIDALVQVVRGQMATDRKSTPLKTLQGQIWSSGYADGNLKGEVFSDVCAAFAKWTDAGIGIAIYSSGSVAAQKLLFGHSEHGDMLHYFRRHFDTTIGAKQQASSYEAIVRELGISAEQLLFLTDVVGEAKAAKAAGVRAILVERPCNYALSNEDRAEFTVVKTFADVSLVAKRKRGQDIGAEDQRPAKVANLLAEPDKMIDDVQVDRADQNIGLDSDIPIANGKSDAIGIDHKLAEDTNDSNGLVGTVHCSNGLLGSVDSPLSEFSDGLNLNQEVEIPIKASLEEMNSSSKEAEADFDNLLMQVNDNIVSAQSNDIDETFERENEVDAILEDIVMSDVNDNVTPLSAARSEQPDCGLIEAIEKIADVEAMESSVKRCVPVCEVTEAVDKVKADGTLDIPEKSSIEQIKSDKEAMDAFKCVMVALEFRNKCGEIAADRISQFPDEATVNDHFNETIFDVVQPQSSETTMNIVKDCKDDDVTSTTTNADDGDNILDTIADVFVNPDDDLHVPVYIENNGDRDGIELKNNSADSIPSANSLATNDDIDLQAHGHKTDTANRKQMDLNGDLLTKNTEIEVVGQQEPNVTADITVHKLNIEESNKEKHEKADLCHNISQNENTGDEQQAKSNGDKPKPFEEAEAGNDKNSILEEIRNDDPDLLAHNGEADVLTPAEKKTELPDNTPEVAPKIN